MVHGDARMQGRISKCERLLPTMTDMQTKHATIALYWRPPMHSLGILSIVMQSYHLSIPRAFTVRSNFGSAPASGQLVASKLFVD